MRSLEELKQLDPETFTAEEWNFLEYSGIVNGIGPSGFPLFKMFLRILSPHFDQADGNFHDWAYYVGGTKFDRIRADYGFYRRMVADLYKNTYTRNIRYATLAYLYFVSVRMFGFLFFKFW